MSTRGQNYALYVNAAERRMMSDINDILTNEVYYSFITIFSLIMIIFVTGVLGFHMLKKFKNPFTGKPFNEKKIDYIAKWILILIWLLLLITECIRLNKKLRRP